MMRSDIRYRRERGRVHIHATKYGEKIGHLDLRKPSSGQEKVTSRVSVHIQDCMKQNNSFVLRKDVIMTSHPDVVFYGVSGTISASPYFVYTSNRGMKCQHSRIGRITPTEKDRDFERLAQDLSTTCQVLMSKGSCYTLPLTTLRGFIKSKNVFRSFNAAMNFIVDMASYYAMANFTTEQAGRAMAAALLRISQCFTEERVVGATCPGHFIVAPPNSGKTWVNTFSNLLYVDTDDLNCERLNARPDIIKNLLRCGFSIMSNTWEWKLYTQEFQVIAILPKDKTMIRKWLQEKKIDDGPIKRIVHEIKRADANNRKEFQRNQGKEKAQGQTSQPNRAKTNRKCKRKLN